MVGRAYLDPGDRLSGRRDPPVRVVVLARWGPGGGPVGARGTCWSAAPTGAWRWFRSRGDCEGSVESHEPLPKGRGLSLAAKRRRPSAA